MRRSGAGKARASSPEVEGRTRRKAPAARHVSWKEQERSPIEEARQDRELAIEGQTYHRTDRPGGNHPVGVPLGASAGAAAGALAGIPIGPVGIVAGTVTGGILGALAGHATVDKVAQKDDAPARHKPRRPEVRSAPRSRRRV